MIKWKLVEEFLQGEKVEDQIDRAGWEVMQELFLASLILEALENEKLMARVAKSMNKDLTWISKARRRRA